MGTNIFAPFSISLPPLPNDQSYQYMGTCLKIRLGIPCHPLKSWNIWIWAIKYMGTSPYTEASPYEGGRTNKSPHMEAHALSHINKYLQFLAFVRVYTLYKIRIN